MTNSWSSTVHSAASAQLFAAVTLAVLLAGMPASVHAQIQINALTPQEALNMPDGTTPISIVASSLLASSTPGVLWGTIPGDAVNSVCDGVGATGQLSFSASVVYNGNPIWRNMQIQALGGCGAAGPNAPDGVEAVLLDDDGVISALVCPQQNSGSSGCYLFDTGDDITGFYNAALSSSTSNSNGELAEADALGGGRKLLNCFTEGTVDGAYTGAIGGLAASIVFCPGSMVNLVCDAAFVIAGAGMGAGLGVLFACTAVTLSNCFPGHALVTTSMGLTLPMSHISLGDKVAVRKPDGAIAFSPVYAFGHADPNTTTVFIKLTLQYDKQDCDTQHCPSTMRTMTLSPDHFAPTVHAASKQITYKRAKNITVGDLMLSASDDIKETFTCTVTDVMLTVERGLYNPFTLEGNIIVDGVVASVHSNWFLDHSFDILGIPHLLHEAYQVVMLPAMILHRFLGEKMYHDLYITIDQKVGIATTGTLYGGHVAMLTIITVIFSGVICLKRSLEMSFNHK